MSDSSDPKPEARAAGVTDIRCAGHCALCPQDGRDGPPRCGLREAHFGNCHCLASHRVVGDKVVAALEAAQAAADPAQHRVTTGGSGPPVEDPIRLDGPLKPSADCVEMDALRTCVYALTHLPPAAQARCVGFLVVRFNAIGINALRSEPAARPPGGGQ